jgi:hypothetical protein
MKNRILKHLHELVIMHDARKRSKTRTRFVKTFRKLEKPETLESRELLAAASFDGNSRGDLVGFAGDQIWVATSNGNSITSTNWGSWSNSSQWDFQSVGDFNGDGRTDIIGRMNSGLIYVGISTGQSFSSSYWGSIDSAYTYRDQLIGDFNNDGRDDFVARDDQGRWWVAYSTGNSFSISIGPVWSTFTTWSSANKGDFNGDGYDDIIARAESGAWWTALGSSNGQFQNVFWGAWSPDIHWLDVRVGDVNGDGRDDIAGRTWYGQWWVAKSTTFGSSSELWTTWSPFVQWQDVHLIDINGSGRASLVGRTNTGAWWSGVSTGSSFSNQFWAAWDGSRTWKDVTSIDVNGDGKSDIIGRTSGAWWAAVSTGNTFQNRLMGAWAPVPWVRVQGSSGSPSLLIERAPTTSGLQPGSVLHEVNQLLGNKIKQQRDYLVYLDSNDGGALNFGQQILNLDAVAASIDAYDAQIVQLLNGSVSEIRVGPEVIMNHQTLAMADRVVLSFLEQTDPELTVGAIDSIDDVNRIAVGAYNQLVDETLSNSRESVDRLTEILSIAAGPLSFMVEGVANAAMVGITAALETGKVIAANRAATVEDYRQSVDSWFSWANDAGDAFYEVVDSWANTSEKESTLKTYLNGVYDNLQGGLINQFNYGQNQSMANQIQNNFGLVQTATTRAAELYIPQVSGTSGDPEDWVDLGPPTSYFDAVRVTQEWFQANPTSLRLTRELPLCHRLGTCN